MNEPDDVDLDPGVGSDTDVEPNTEPDADAALPADAVEEAARLTRLARAAVDPDERDVYRERRAELVADHGYAARVREEDAREVLVLYPDEWLDDGLVRTDRIDDTGRAIERLLSGPGDPDDWDAVDAHNRSIAARVADRYGPVHGANARAFADFMGNHYARRVDSATDDEVAEFLTEYFPRNAWPTAEQKRAVEDSIDRVFDAATTDDPSSDTDLDPDPNPDSDASDTDPGAVDRP